MHTPFSRRQLLSGIGITLSSQAIAHPWLDFLQDTGLKKRVLEILKRHLNIPLPAEVLVGDFVRSLQTRNLHTEKPEVFRRMAESADAQAELEAYVVEEFVVSSNFFAMQSGEDQAWRLYTTVEKQALLG